MLFHEYRTEENQRLQQYILINMKPYNFLLPLILSSVVAISQPSKNILKNIPSGFAFRNELSQFVFMPGGQFISGIVMGRDSINLQTKYEAVTENFYLNKYEVSNAEYRQFVLYVRDSLAHRLLGHIIKTGHTEITDWQQKIDWKNEKLYPLMIKSDDRFYGMKELDTEKMMYRFAGDETVAVYPDTLVWIRDFAYSYNEPMAKKYFSHPAFNHYPVIGVSAIQAMAFCYWKTHQLNKALEAVGSKLKATVRLPSAAEWEYAARSGAGQLMDTNRYDFDIFDLTQRTDYPNPTYGDTDKSISNKGYKYNFGVIADANGFIVKSYADDGCFYMARRNSYKADKNGLFNLHGNVAEWTSTPGALNQPGINNMEADNLLKSLTTEFPRSPLAGLSPEEAHQYLQKFRVVKGGSWASVPFYLQPGANEYFLPGAAHSFIGFRTVLTVQEHSGQ
jgi:sulfatase modifying factor 1